MKSHVSLEQAQCVVCARLYDTGTVLLDMRLRDSLEAKTCTGYGKPCPACQRQLNDDRIAMIGMDESKSAVKGDHVQPQDAYRTGTIAWLKREAFENMFNVPPPEHKICFCQQEVIDKLQQAHKDAGLGDAPEVEA